MTRIMTPILILTIAAGTAIAHAEVQNPVVKARMEAMKAIGGNMKTISQMAKGEMDFDAAKAGDATAAIADTAAKVPTLFEAPETDPEAEAKPAIWEDFDDFTKKAMATEAAARAADTSSLDALRASLGQIGGTCKACHDDYRIKK